MWIYKITNKINGKAYIGRTVCKKVYDRWKSHKSAKSGGGISAIKAAILKYGEENFIFETLHKASSENELSELEAKIIKELNTMAPNGYNLTTGGENYTRSPFAKKGGYKKGNMPWNKGLDESDSRVQRMIRRGKESSAYGNKYRKGIKHTLKTREIISKKQIGKKISEQTKKRMSESQKKIKIRCFQNNKIYPSIMDASRDLKLNPGLISKVVRGISPHTRGYIFEVVNA